LLKFHEMLFSTRLSADPDESSIPVAAASGFGLMVLWTYESRRTERNDWSRPTL